MAVCNLKTLSVLAVLVALTAILYRKRTSDMSREKLDDVLRGLLRAEKKVGIDKNTRIALGFGGCEDIFVNAMEVLEKLNYSVPFPEHLDNIITETDFSKMFAYFFGYGAAAEYV